MCSDKFQPNTNPQENLAQAFSKIQHVFTFTLVHDTDACIKVNITNFVNKIPKTRVEKYVFVKEISVLKYI